MSFKSIAEMYLMAGLNPLPLRDNKAPNLPKGHNFLYELNETFTNFNSTETKKIGIACGEVSENLLCIDFDKHQGQDIYSIFKKYCDCSIIKMLVELKKISIYKTPSQGFHIVFRTENPLKGTTLSRYEDGNIMIETRGEGQYIACFPSEGYKFLYGCELSELRKLDEDESEYLLDRALIYNRDISKTKKRTGSLVNDDKKKWPDEWDNSTPDGRFNNIGGDYVKNLLREKGWSLSKDYKETDEIEYWIRPNKIEEDGISASFGFKKNMFYVFSDSPDIQPLEKEVAYSPFGLLTELEYKGDWKQAKDDLRDTYGMKPIKELTKVSFIEDEIQEDYSFPIEVLPEDYQSYINAVNQTLTYSKDYTACAMMMAVASAIGNKIKIKVKNGYIDSPIFWMAIVGSRGANKTHPITNVLKPFKSIEDKNFIKYSIALNEFKMLKEEEKNKTQKPHYKQITISDFTIEALQQCLVFNKKGILLYKDELKGFFSDMNKYRKSGGDEEFFLESFNNGSFTINRKTQDTVRVNKIFINILGTIQDEVLTNLAINHTDNGLLDRFLFTKSEQFAKPLTKDDLPDEYMEWWDFKIKTISEELNYFDEDDIKICEMTEDAFNYLLIIEEKYTNIQNDESTLPALQNYYSKLRTYVKRFALLIMIIEYCEYGTELIIELEHMQKSEKIIDYFSKSAKSVFENNAKNNEKTEIFNDLKGKSVNEKIILLHKKGLKIVEIAKLVGMSRQFVSKILK